MRNDISIHTKLFLSPRTFVASSEAEYLLSLTIRFPHTSFLSQTSTQYPFFSFPSLLSTLEYPVFHLAAPWAVWMFPVRYVTSFLESLPPARCHCITCQLLCTSQWGSFFSAFLRQKYDPPNGDGISSVLKVRLPPPTQVKLFHLQQNDLLHNSRGREEQSCLQVIQMTHYLKL